ncbi:hypothetical protein LWM68_31935 [Niabella sp. W65]|nr:hypothetical protein [Niabella sp. W65]MCH7366971.1 hypothetical protein [Niabella sp. W65]
MAGAYRGIDIVLGYGPYEKHPGFLNKVIRFETFHSALQYLSYALAGHPYMGVGRNLSYKKELFLQHKGFASISHIPGGDDDLFISKASTRSNTTIMIDPDAHTMSVPKKHGQPGSVKKPGITVHRSIISLSINFCWVCTAFHNSYFTHCLLQQQYYTAGLWRYCSC